MITAATVAAGIGLLVAPRLRPCAQRRRAGAQRADPGRGARARRRPAARLGPADAGADPAKRGCPPQPGPRAPPGARAARLAVRRRGASTRRRPSPRRCVTLPRTSRRATGSSSSSCSRATRRLDERLEALVGAAREAITNAAKHAGVDDGLGARARDRRGGVACSSATAAAASIARACPRTAHGLTRVDRGADGAPRRQGDDRQRTRRRHRGRAGAAAMSPAAAQGRPRRRPRDLPRRAEGRARRDDPGRRRGGHGRSGGAADQARGSRRRPARRPPARRRRPGSDRPGPRRAPRRPLPRAVGVRRGGRRRRRDPRGRTGVRDEVDLAARPDRRDPPHRRRRRGLLALARRLRARRVHRLGVRRRLRSSTS